MHTFSFFCRKDQRRLITYSTFLYQYGILLNYIKNQNKKQNYESQLHSYAHGFLQQRYMHIGGISDAITCHATFYIVPNMKKNQTKLKLFGSNPNKITKRKKAKSCTVASTMSITQRDNVQEQVSVCVTWRKISLERSRAYVHWKQPQVVNNIYSNANSSLKVQCWVASLQAA